MGSMFRLRRNFKKMKIDKVIFTTSVEYSDFWDINSKIFSECLGIEPLCLLFGKREDAKISDKHGKIIEMDFIPGLPKMPQIALWKFYYTQGEPETTWMIGDIDQIPLQSYAFVDQIKNVPEDHYVHLSENELSEKYGHSPKFWMNEPKPDGSTDLPAHYHVAKGKVFKEFLSLDVPFKDWVTTMLYQRLRTPKPYGLGLQELEDIPDWDVEKYFYGAKSRDCFWAYEEPYTTKLIRNHLNKNRYSGFSRGFHQKICRSTNCSYETAKLKNNFYVDLHAPCPYLKHKEKIDHVVNAAWNK